MTIVDKIQKALQKLNPKERIAREEILERLASGKEIGLDMKLRPARFRLRGNEFSAKARARRASWSLFATAEIKKLKGRGDIFRARKGSLRTIYRLDAKGKVFILAIERRREDTYKF